MVKVHRQYRNMHLTIGLLCWGLLSTLFGCASLLALERNASVTAPPRCPTTAPNESTPPGEDPSKRGYHGNEALWTDLSWPEGKIVFRPGGVGRVLPDGSLSIKFPWWRGVRGKLALEGRRLDAPAPQLRSNVPEGYGDIGFQATALIFPTEGCWEVTGRVGDSVLTFVVLVSKET